MAHAAVKKSARKAQQKSVEHDFARLLAYLSDYGSVEPPQAADRAHLDSQLKSIVTALALMIDRGTSGTFVDVGAGNGILLERMADVDAFRAGPEWQYVAVEDKALHDGILAVATRHRIHKRVDVLGLDEFYGEWRRPNTDRVIAICRNVLHELSIADTASFCHKLASTLRASDILVIQDLAVFPRAEKGNACWGRPDLEALIRELGFEPTAVDDTSAAGNRWFNIIARRTAAAPPAANTVRELVRDRRVAQWRRWHQLGALHPEDARFRSVELAKIDFDLQYAGLTRQLVSEGADVAGLTPQNEQLVAKELFLKALGSPTITVPTTGLILNEIHHFKDRANSQEALQQFLTSDKPISLIYGPPLMGKSTLVAHVVAIFHHARLPIVIDVQSTTTVWNVLESILSATGCAVPIEILGRLRTLRLADVREPLESYWERVSSKLIVTLDHVERLLQPTGEIADIEIAALLQLLASTPGTKLIITSRREVSTQSVPLQLRDAPEPPVGRFPLGAHVENLLSTVAGITQFSAPLLEAIDRHPHLAYLAALVLRKEGPQAADEPNFLSDIRQRFRATLAERIASPAAKPALELLSLLRCAVPREFAAALSSDASITAGESVGLIVADRDASRFGRVLVRCLEPLRMAPRADDDAGACLDETVDAPSQRESRRQEEISDAYLSLYRRDDDPRWLREATYHRISVGDVAALTGFGVAYRTEIFAAGEFWFLRRKDFKSALWAFETVDGFGGTSVAVKMRIGSCCLRVGDQQRGDRIFGELVARYPTDAGIKMSYIDALLYVGRFEEALGLLENAFAEPTAPWSHGQYGRAYMGLHRYNEAVASFRSQLALSDEPVVYSSLARALHRIGGRREEGEILVRGVRRHSRSRGLRRELASWKEKNGFREEALSLFEALLREDASDGWVIYPYVQTLCAMGRLQDATDLWGTARSRARPEFLRPVIEAHLLMRAGRFEDALISLGELAQADEHRDGQRSEIYAAWANAVAPEAERRRVAALGLRPIGELPGNVPLLISQSKLALLAHDVDRLRLIVAKIRGVNLHAPDLERIEREAEAIFGADDD